MKTEVSIIITGIDRWEQYTLPLIKSIQQFEPDVEIVVIDNESYAPYPQVEGVKIIRTRRMSYAAAINCGAANSEGRWILQMNNDVLCTGKFVDFIKSLDKNAIYGMQIIEEAGHIWLGNWIALMTRKVFGEVGGFDPLFEMCGFEDADFCIRAKKLGHDTLPVDLPFFHYWGKTRWALSGYPAVREANIKYFEQKHGFRLGFNMRVIYG